jgi:hypothetical protein
MREEEEDRIGHGSIGLTDIWFFSDQPDGFFDVRIWFFTYHSITSDSRIVSRDSSRDETHVRNVFMREVVFIWFI